MKESFAKEILTFCTEKISKINGIVAITATGSHINGNFHKYSDIDISFIINKDMHKVRDKVREYFKKNFDIIFFRWQESIKQDVIWIKGNYMVDLTYPSLDFLENQMEKNSYWKKRVESSKVLYDSKNINEKLLRKKKNITCQSKIENATHTSKELITIYNSILCGLTKPSLSLIKISIPNFNVRILKLLSIINNTHMNPRYFRKCSLEHAPKNWIKRINSMYCLSNFEDCSKTPRIAKKLAIETFELANKVLKTKKFNKYIEVLNEYN